ncbi:hypothetical protein QYE76_019706 [Lolium multiflorum]|uniref:Myb/SANT-like domain-containing protein n=1 Tax=Lolium multiflorum TaxID=4521 RepID=A0AAD8R713_LOLMU|nr:hypothetical protein QYE76_019706 [Lolium multiflorum]
MDANWRPTQGSGPASAGDGGVDPNAPAEGDWRAQLQPEARSRIVNKIMVTLKKHLPVSVPEGLNELQKIAERFEERIYNEAPDQSNYLRKISLKMLSMETKTQQAPGNAQVIPNQNNPGQGNQNRAWWTDDQTKMLVSTMKEYADASQYRGPNGWTKEGWNFMAAHLNKQFTSSNLTVKQVKYRAQRLKGDYTIVKSILDRSGFGWDPENKVPKSIDGKWDELSQEQRKWRFKEFPYYDDLNRIYEGKAIQGKRCKRITDVLEEKYNSPHFVIEETFTEQVLRAPRQNSPSPTLDALGLGVGDYNRDTDEKYKLPETPPVKRLRFQKEAMKASLRKARV